MIPKQSTFSYIPQNYPPWRPYAISDIQPETHLKLKSREVSFACNLFSSYPIILKFCTEHGNITAMLCAKFQNDCITETGVIEKRDFMIFEFKRSLRWISYIAQQPCFLQTLSLNILSWSQYSTSVSKFHSARSIMFQPGCQQQLVTMKDGDECMLILLALDQGIGSIPHDILWTFWVKYLILPNFNYIFCTVKSIINLFRFLLVIFFQSSILCKCLMDFACTVSMCAFGTQLHLLFLRLKILKIFYSVTCVVSATKMSKIFNQLLKCSTAVM